MNKYFRIINLYNSLSNYLFIVDCFRSERKRSKNASERSECASTNEVKLSVA